ncbi:MAG: DUF3455 domain-containing protein [Bryobacteraceae bacterium]
MIQSIRERALPSFITMLALTSAGCTTNFTELPIVRAAQSVKKLDPPAGSVRLLSAHAVGYQVYACEADGKWSRSEPIGALVTQKGEIIRHYRDKAPAAPAWEAADGTKVHAMLANGKPDQSVDSAIPNSIPQLGLNVVPGDGKGTFGRVAYIIRANTKGGMQPAGSCKLPPGTRYSTYYEADYFFYGQVSILRQSRRLSDCLLLEGAYSQSFPFPKQYGKMEHYSRTSAAGASTGASERIPEAKQPGGLPS